MLRSLPFLAFLIISLESSAQTVHHYVAAVQGIETNAQEKELLHYLQVKDPNGRYVIDQGTGDVDIHTSTFISEGRLGEAVNAFGLLLLHFQEVKPEARPRRRRNTRSA